MTAEEYFKRGQKFSSEKNFDGAIADFTEVIKLEPDDPFAYDSRGMAYTDKKEFDLAIADFTEAIRLEPNKIGVFYFNRGGAYIFNGNTDLAISDLEMAVKIDPKNENFSGARKALQEELSGRSSGRPKSSGGQKSAETLKKEIRVILICAGVGALIGAILLNVTATEFGVGFSTFMGIWAGLGIGGNIVLFPFLFIKGLTLFDWLDSKGSFISSIISSKIWRLLIGLIIGLFLVYVGFVACFIAGPILPLIRILIKRSQIKNSKE